ncbi:MAG: class I SAM-dependent methyltransferase [Chitinophagales bacterium]
MTTAFAVTASVSGLDLSPEMIRLAADRLGAKTDLKVGDSEDLPWPDGTFDAVTCSSSYHHYPQPQKALSEMRRVLKPGGQLVLADVWLPTPLRQIRNYVLIPNTKEGDVRVYSRLEITSLLESAELELASWRRIGLLGCVAEARKIWFRRDKEECSGIA